MLLFPTNRDRLPVLTVRRKGEWVGIRARFVGLLVWIGLRTPWWKVTATTFMEKFHTTIGRTLWQATKSTAVSLSLWLHEGLHAWQEQTYGTLRYYWMYSRKKGRAQLEAQAYSAEVAAGYKTAEVAARQLANPLYRLDLTVPQAREFVDEYVEAWRDSDVDLVALGKTAMPPAD